MWPPGRSPGAFYRTPRVQRGTLAGGGGRHTRQSDLRSAVLGRRARCQAVGIWALLLLAAYDLQFVRGRRIFPVLRYRRRRRLGCDRAEMAARVGMARRLDCARNGFVGTCVSMEDLRFRPKIPAELNSAGANKLPMRPQPRPETNGDSHPIFRFMSAFSTSFANYRSAVRVGGLTTSALPTISINESPGIHSTARHARDGALPEEK